MTNWYKKYIYAQGADQYLASLGASPEVIQYILSEENNSQLLINEFRKNPRLTTEQLRSFIFPQKNIIDPYLERERRRATVISNDNIFQQWVLVNFRKIRKGRLPPENQVNRLNEVLNIEEQNKYLEFDEIIDQIADWYNSIQPDIASYSPEQAIQASDEWHQMMAGKGEGLYYESTKPELIMYGPEWKNKNWQGWTIQRVMSENDLLAEGNKMSNCVGSYCSGVQNESLIIYSLRDPQNKPVVTIETDETGKIAEQIKGFGNNIPDDDYRTMISEWVTSDKNSPKQMKPGNEYYWEIGGELQSISSQLDDLRRGYIRDDTDYESNLAEDYGLENPDPPEFTKWSNNFDVEELMKIIFETIIYSIDLNNIENINWYSTSIIKELILTVRHFDKEQDTNHYIKLLVGILKEQLGYSPTMLSDNKKEQQVQKGFAQTVLNKIYEPSEQREFSFSSNMNWYKKQQR